jgi:uncharacterized protein YegJ (DUF2314 family)
MWDHVMPTSSPKGNGLNLSLPPRDEYKSASAARRNRRGLPMTSKGFATLLDAAKTVGLTERPPSGESILDKAERDELAIVANGDPLMAAAMRKARATLAEFLALAGNPGPTMEGFAVKVAIHEGCEAEYFWIHPFAHQAGRFSGHLSNTPRSLARVKAGDAITFSENEIVDWTYMDGDKMKGNYTARALLKKASWQEQEDFKKRFGLDIDF